MNSDQNLTSGAGAGLKPPPPAVFRWAVLVVISLAMFGNYYIYDSIAPIADILKSDLGFSDENIGQLYSFYSIAAVIVLLIGGVIIDKFGTAKSTVLFGSICTVAAVMMAATDNLTVMLTARFLLGIGSEPLIVAITTALAKWFKGRELSFAFGVKDLPSSWRKPISSSRRCLKKWTNRQILIGGKRNSRKCGGV